MERDDVVVLVFLLVVIAGIVVAAVVVLASRGGSENRGKGLQVLNSMVQEVTGVIGKADRPDHDADSSD